MTKRYASTERKVHKKITTRYAPKERPIKKIPVVFKREGYEEGK